MATFRKNNKNGNWEVFGPASEVKPGNVAVRKADGSTSTVNVEGVSAPFDVNGVPHVYGFLPVKAPTNKPRTTQSHGPCAECGRAPGVVLRHDSSGIGGYCCSRCARYSQMELSFA